MDTDEWEQEFAEAGRRLLDSTDCHALRRRGHDLKRGVVLTSVSDVPFEISLKCSLCRVAFWFENPAWSSGRIGRWHISSVSREEAENTCAALSIGARVGAFSCPH
jgi:hypothetical protein